MWHVSPPLPLLQAGARPVSQPPTPTGTAGDDRGMKATAPSRELTYTMRPQNRPGDGGAMLPTRLVAFKCPNAP